MPAELPGSLSGPDVASSDAPSDDWFSPGHSPGIAQVDGDFVLGGRTLLFEILGTEPGLMYDQLQVSGDVLLDSGNVVFAFINGYVPDDPTDLFELIIATNIEVDFSGVDFYYGFFDPLLGDPSWDLHAPNDLGLYRVWDPGSGIAMTDQDGNAIRAGDIGTFDGFLGIQYAGGAVPAPPVDQPSQPFRALDIPVPAPAPLWLLAGGALLFLRARRRG